VTNRNRGGFGWEAPPPGAQGYRAAHDAAMAFDSFIREQFLRGMHMQREEINAAFFGFDAGDASPAPPPRNPLAIHDDPIDMIEINGVWMCRTDAIATLRGIEAR